MGVSLPQGLCAAVKPHPAQAARALVRYHRADTAEMLNFIPWTKLTFRKQIEKCASQNDQSPGLRGLISALVSLWCHSRSSL